MLGGTHSWNCIPTPSVEEALIEDTPPVIYDAYSMLLRVHPMYRRFMGEMVPEPFSDKTLTRAATAGVETVLLGGGTGEFPNFLNESSAFYIYFSLRIAPESKIAGPREFEAVYRINLDVEVRGG